MANVYLCKVTVALDATPAMACHVLADTNAEAKAIAEAHFFKPVEPEVRASAPNLADHVEKAQSDARDSWFTVSASKFSVDASNAINR